MRLGHKVTFSPLMFEPGFRAKCTCGAYAEGLEQAELSSWENYHKAPSPKEPPLKKEGFVSGLPDP